MVVDVVAEEPISSFAELSGSPISKPSIAVAPLDTLPSAPPPAAAGSRASQVEINQQKGDN